MCIPCRVFAIERKHPAFYLRSKPGSRIALATKKLWHTSAGMEVLVRKRLRKRPDHERHIQKDKGGKFMVFPRNSQAYWQDDYLSASDENAA